MRVSTKPVRLAGMANERERVCAVCVLEALHVLEGTRAGRVVSVEELQYQTSLYLLLTPRLRAEAKFASSIAYHIHRIPHRTCFTGFSSCTCEGT